MKFFDPEECKAPPRADMYLPLFLFVFSFVLYALAVACVVISLFVPPLSMLWIGAPICAVLGVAAYLCWKNQTVKIIDDERFAYTTMLGKTVEYRFADIVGLRNNADSMTLILTDGKVHIESMARISFPLRQKIEEALEKLDRSEE